MTCEAGFNPRDIAVCKHVSKVVKQAPTNVRRSHNDERCGPRRMEMLKCWIVSCLGRYPSHFLIWTVTWVVGMSYSSLRLKTGARGTLVPHHILSHKMCSFSIWSLWLVDILPQSIIRLWQSHLVKHNRTQSYSTRWTMHIRMRRGKADSEVMSDVGFSRCSFKEFCRFLITLKYGAYQLFTTENTIYKLFSSTSGP